jgi:hypothetical protein
MKQPLLGGGALHLRCGRTKMRCNMIRGKTIAITHRTDRIEEPGGQTRDESRAGAIKP